MFRKGWGEPLAGIILALNAKGKDKACYTLYGAWMAYFVLDQLYELPGMLVDFAANMGEPAIAITIGLRVLTMVCIIAIGVLLVRYVSDGVINNRAYNALCVASIVPHLLVIGMLTMALVFGGPTEGGDPAIMRQQAALIIFNYVYRILMIFLMAFFAYDSAKHEKKAKLAK